MTVHKEDVLSTHFECIFDLIFTFLEFSNGGFGLVKIFIYTIL